jgi:Catalytic LigB subunit of aromatic ring-opening dioxygenase
MPIGLGLAASHAPNVFVAPDDWEVRYKRAIDDVPQPLKAKEETQEVRRAYGRRIEAAFATLRAKLEAYKPDALIMVSDDHSEMFDESRCNPSLAMFVGKRGKGVLNLLKPETLDDPGAQVITINCHEELSQFIAKGLVKRDFDLTLSRQDETISVGAHNMGMGHGFSRMGPTLVPRNDIPAVLIWLNCYYEPLPTARRCLALGRAIADVVRDRPERIAILGTGGLSHDPRGPRAGWIDEPLDRSVLKAFAEGDPDRLSVLFELDSDTYHGGTGEIRNWLVAGAAMDRCKATIIDYMPIHHVVTGVAFAYWEKA